MLFPFHVAPAAQVRKCSYSIAQKLRAKNVDAKAVLLHGEIYVDISTRGISASIALGLLGYVEASAKGFYVHARSHRVLTIEGPKRIQVEATGARMLEVPEGVAAPYVVTHAGLSHAEVGAEYGRLGWNRIGAGLIDRDTDYLGFTKEVDGYTFMADVYTKQGEPPNSYLEAVSST